VIAPVRGGERQGRSQGREVTMTNAARMLLRRSTGAIALLVAVAAVVTASTSCGGRYTVRPGDTLSAIAARYHVSVAQLRKLNRVGSGDLVHPGDVLRLAP
jgi:LysM repeat protein